MIFQICEGSLSWLMYWYVMGFVFLGLPLYHCYLITTLITGQGQPPWFLALDFLLKHLLQGNQFQRWIQNSWAVPRIGNNACLMLTALLTHGLSDVIRRCECVTLSAAKHPSCVTNSPWVTSFASLLWHTSLSRSSIYFMSFMYNVHWTLGWCKYFLGGISTSIFCMRVPLGKNGLHAKFQTFRPINDPGPPIWSFTL